MAELAKGASSQDTPHQPAATHEAAHTPQTSNQVCPINSSCILLLPVLSCELVVLHQEGMSSASFSWQVCCYDAVCAFKAEQCGRTAH